MAPATFNLTGPYRRVGGDRDPDPGREPPATDNTAVTAGAQINATYV